MKSKTRESFQLSSQVDVIVYMSAERTVKRSGCFSMGTFSDKKQSNTSNAHTAILIAKNSTKDGRKYKKSIPKYHNILMKNKARFCLQIRRDRNSLLR